MTQGFKANPGLKLANAFSVRFATRQGCNTTTLSELRKFIANDNDQGLKANLGQPWAGMSERLPRWVSENLRNRHNPR